MHWIERHWYRITPLHLILFPLSLAFAALAALRRGLYRAGVLGASRLPVPVIVVGNITVGGTGKTPLTLWIAGRLQQQGFHPGIVSRGYGADRQHPRPVAPDGDPAGCGDEPVLLARRSGCPVWVGRDRAGAARGLLAANPQCDVIICDDGLQHYALARDFEIALVDGARPLGNGLRLPAGPLREGAGRLRSVDAVVINGGDETMAGLDTPQFTLRLEGAEFYNLLNPRLRVPAARFRGQRVHGVAGIGRPQRFFDRLRELGLTGSSHPFPDHHRYRPEDFDPGDASPILMTEKDAIKCTGFADERFWVLPVQAQVTPDLMPLILARIGAHHGSEAA